MVLQFAHGEDATLYHIVWDGLCFPVAFAWQAFFRARGMQGDQGMIFILPMYLSAILYLACLGFFVGALARRVFKTT